MSIEKQNQAECNFFYFLFKNEETTRYHQHRLKLNCFQSRCQEKKKSVQFTNAFDENVDPGIQVKIELWYNK